MTLPARYHSDTVSSMTQQQRFTISLPAPEAQRLRGMPNQSAYVAALISRDRVLSETLAAIHAAGVPDPTQEGMDAARARMDAAADAGVAARRRAWLADVLRASHGAAA